jgi:hypothetical protein
MKEQWKLPISGISTNFNRVLPFIEPAGQNLWLDENVGEVISSEEVISRYGLHLPAHMRKVPDLPKWLRTFTDSCECRLIETQRLLKLVPREDNYRVRRPIGYAFPTRAVVDEEARDLANRIGDTLKDYANRSQTLDQSFPNRVIGALYSSDAPTSGVVLDRLSGVDKKRSSLIEAGLIDATGAPEILREVTQAELEGREGRKVRQVIDVYLNDTEQKLSRFDQLFPRVSLFQEIINEKFQYKSVSVSSEKGISVNSSGTGIPLSDLSSGEQHELVLLYELLFGISENALILIDEPELSLHVGWRFRAAYTHANFQRSSVYRDITAWEGRNRPFKVLI